MSTSFNFPANPNVGDFFTLPNGSIAQWNGSEWISVSDTNITYPLPVTLGGTGHNTAAGARVNLGIDAVGGQRQFPDGTVAAPGAAWESELGMGFYRPAANQIAVARGGLQRFLFDGSSVSGSVFVLKADPAASGGALLIVDSGINAQASVYGRKAGSVRWTMQLGNADAETGSNAGSNFVLSRYTDAGGVLSDVMRISRSDGQALFTRPFQIGDGAGGNGQLRLSGDAASGKDIYGTVAGVARWILRLGSGTGDGGDDFVVYRYNDAGVAQSGQLRILRSNGNIITTGSIQTGANLNGAGIYGGGTSSETQIWPAATAASGPPGAWPNTSGGMISVRGNANGNYSGAGAITCYSGSGSTGATILNGATTWSAASDIREKNVESEVEDGLEAVLAMRPIRYRYIFEDASARLRVGLSAQSVQTHVPEAVSEVSKLGEDGQPTGETRLNLALTDVIPAMVNAIQQLNARLAALEAP